MARKKETMTATADPQPNNGKKSAHAFQASSFWRLMPSGMRRRWWLFRLVDLIARYFPTFKARRGLLVIRMDGIGDMVLFRRALDHYADVFKVQQSDITIVGCESWGPTTDDIFAGYRVLVINEHRYAKRMFYRLGVSLRVRRVGAAVCVNDSYFRRAMMADSLAWVSGAPRTISSLPYISERNRQEYQYYLSQVDEVINTGYYPVHEVERHYQFLSEIAGREISPEAPTIPWRDRAAPADKLAPGEPYAVFNPGSNEYGRRWPLDKYLALAAKVRERGIRVVFVGGSGEKPGEVTGDDPGIIDLMGQTSLPELLDIMKGAALVVSNDTGPAHLSIAIGAPTVVIVGGGHFGSFVPYPETIRPANARFVFQEMDCYHCFWRCPKRADKFKVFPCVAAVEVDQAWAEAEHLLAAEGTGS